MFCVMVILPCFFAWFGQVSAECAEASNRNVILEEVRGVWSVCVCVLHREGNEATSTLTSLCDTSVDLLTCCCTKIRHCMWPVR
jgi:hypothetical protein